MPATAGHTADDIRPEARDARPDPRDGRPKLIDVRPQPMTSGQPAPTSPTTASRATEPPAPTSPAAPGSSTSSTAVPPARPALRAVPSPEPTLRPVRDRRAGRRRATPTPDPLGERRGGRVGESPSDAERVREPRGELLALPTALARSRSMAAHPSLYRRPALDGRSALHRVIADAPETSAEWDQDPAELCANLALCVVEIVAGARSLDQLARWVTDAVYLQLLRRTVIAARGRAVAGEEPLRPRVTVGTPRVSEPCDGVVEAVVLVHQTARSRAVTIRLERHRSRWRATALTLL